MAYRSSDTTVTEKGQVTIPVEVRKALGLKPRDRVRIDYDDETETATIRPVRSVAEMLRGMAQPRQRPENFRQIREEFERGVAEDAVSDD